MNKLIVVFTSSLMIMLVGCNSIIENTEPVDSQETVEEHEEEMEQSNQNTYDSARFVVTEVDSKKSIMTDKKSLVQYLRVYRNGGVDGGVAIQMLLNTDGTPYVSDQMLEQENRFSTEELNSKSFLYTDNYTGVEYFVVYRNGGFNGGVDITPLYDESGTPLIAE